MPAAILKRGPGRPTLAVDGSDASKLLLKLAPDLRARIKLSANSLGISEQRFIRQAICSYLDTLKA